MYEELFHTLHRDHEEVRTAFRRLKEEDNADDRAKILYALETEILPHMMAEERIVYSRLEAEEGETRQDALESMAEHHALRLVLRDLTETPTNEEIFPAKVRVFEEMVEHHVRVEEKYIFRDIRKHLRRAEAGELLKNFREVKANNPCHPASRDWWGGM